MLLKGPGTERLSYQIVTTKMSSGPETRLAVSVTVCETSPVVAVVSVVVTWLFEVPTRTSAGSRRG